MLNKDKLTVTEKLLLAAFELDKTQGMQFTAEDLVVSAWQMFPRTFGLKGHQDTKGLPKYPDSNRVFAEIMGSKPIRKRGYLVKKGEKIYELTTSGKETASRLLRFQKSGQYEIDNIDQSKTTMSREIISRLERILSSRVVIKVTNGEVEHITFHDACLFWGITPRSSFIELEGCFRDFETLLQHLESEIQAGARGFKAGDSEVSESTPKLLKSIHEDLQKKFEQDLKTIKLRKDERKV
jgi:hypothetical protein